VEVKFSVETELPGIVEVPLLSERDPVIRASIPGKGEGLFIVDTAAEVTFLDESFAERCGLPGLTFDKEVNATRGRERVLELERCTRVERLEIGTAAAFDLHPPLVDLTHIREDLAGIIGQDILSNWIVLFDPPGGRMLLLPPGDIVKHLELLVEPGAALQTMPVSWTDRIPHIEFVNDEGGFVLDMVVDTGATITHLPRSAIDDQKLEQAGSTTINQIDGSEEYTTWRLGKLELGRWQVRNIVVGDSGLPSGLLGYDVLSPFVFIIDGPGEAFHLMRNPVWRDDRSGEGAQ